MGDMRFCTRAGWVRTVVADELGDAGGFDCGVIATRLSTHDEKSEGIDGSVDIWGNTAVVCCRAVRRKASRRSTFSRTQDTASYLLTLALPRTAPKIHPQYKYTQLFSHLRNIKCLSSRSHHLRRTAAS